MKGALSAPIAPATAMIIPICRSLKPNPPTARSADKNRAAIGSHRPYTAYCRNIITYSRRSTRRRGSMVVLSVITDQAIP